ncbi:Soluble secreted antigen MPT53 [Dirofilaria immitis]
MENMKIAARLIQNSSAKTVLWLWWWWCNSCLLQGSNRSERNVQELVVTYIGAIDGVNVMDESDVLIELKIFEIIINTWSLI